MFEDTGDGERYNRAMAKSGLLGLQDVDCVVKSERRIIWKDYS